MLTHTATTTDLTDIVTVIVSYAPRGMGSQMDVIVGHLFGAYYQPLRVLPSYRSTVSKILHHQCGWPPELYMYYRTDITGLQHDLKLTLARYPGVARRCIIRDQIAALVDASTIDMAGKQQLQQYYDPDDADLDAICTYIAGVMCYIICSHTTNVT